MFDLHVHTSASDGTLTPARVVREAVNHGVRFLAITDHDTVAGIDEALETAREFAIDVIPGIEINVDVALDEVHILGYFIDHNNLHFREALTRLQQSRSRRIDRIIEKLADEKIILDRETIDKHHFGNSIGRPHVARALVEMGAAVDVREAFDKYLKRGGTCYVPREKIPLCEAVEIVREAGGIPVVAHPAFIECFEEYFRELLECGLLGIEAYYPYHNELQTEYFVNLARKNGLTVTAGSDFHGYDGRKNGGPGFAGVPTKIMYDFLDFCAEKVVDADRFEMLKIRKMKS
jgi:3',5'-nucleoside bisphosphate phosphatase